MQQSIMRFVVRIVFVFAVLFGFSSFAFAAVEYQQAGHDLALSINAGNYGDGHNAVAYAPAYANTDGFYASWYNETFGTFYTTTSAITTLRVLPTLGTSCTQLWQGFMVLAYTPIKTQINTSALPRVGTDGYGNIYCDFPISIPNGSNLSMLIFAGSSYDPLYINGSSLNTGKSFSYPYDSNAIHDFGWAFALCSNNDCTGAFTDGTPKFSNFGQLKTDAVTAITEGATTTESTLVFKSTLSSSANNQVKFQVELKHIDQSFDGANLLESGFVVSSSTATTTSGTLTEGLYHWRARAMDDKGNASDWQEFGTAGNTDFIVQLPLNIKAAELAKQLVNQNYLWGGKGWDVNNRLFVNTDVVKTGYNYWNPDVGKTGGITKGNGVDCSGLIAWSYNHIVDPFKHFASNFIQYENADGQYRYNTRTVTESELQPGDLLFFDSRTYNPSTKTWTSGPDGVMDHVAMYIGGAAADKNVIHARSKTFGVQYANLFSLLSNRTASGFVSFARPQNTTIAMAVAKHSPVHLSVTDPDGNTISDSTGVATDEEYIRESGDLVYATMGIDANGFPEDVVYSPILKQGVYRINVSPMASSTPSQTYSLDFTTGSTTIPLAQNVPLSQIPINGYGVVVAANNTVTLDVTPPEARISFGASTKKLLVEGVDDLTTTTVLMSATSTIVSDKAGNTLQVVYAMSHQEKNEIKLAINELDYNNVATSTSSKTTLQYEWSLDKKGNIKELEQKATAGGIEVEAHYDAKKNITEIKKKVTGGGQRDKEAGEVKEILQELVIISLITDKGNVYVKY